MSNRIKTSTNCFRVKHKHITLPATEKRSHEQRLSLSLAKIHTGGEFTKEKISRRKEFNPEGYEDTISYLNRRTRTARLAHDFDWDIASERRSQEAVVDLVELRTLGVPPRLLVMGTSGVPPRLSVGIPAPRR